MNKWFVTYPTINGTKVYSYISKDKAQRKARELRNAGFTFVTVRKATRQ